jgi:hypothetical protein
VHTVSHFHDIATSPGNQRLLEVNLKRRLDFFLDPSRIYPWWSKCHVRVLLVTDGGLDFGQGDFGLSTLVGILQNEAPARVKFDMTLAHLRSNVSDAAVMSGVPGIVRSIKGFRFDDPAHFTANMYDEVWMFGIETNFQQFGYTERQANPTRYPAGSLGNDELIRLGEFMNKGGGVFATGDHGALGRGLCGSVTRVRSMRHWNSFTLPGSTQDEVSMTGPKRNDTNRVGNDAGTQFSDQSDDIPQIIEPHLYSSRLSLFIRARYPHPLLCGVNGVINVLPDHPHEGECRVPDSLTLKFTLDGTDEYPLATGGTFRVTPEVIATSRVPAGNTADKAGSKQATITHTFGAISAYDGHLANVGRVSCDATWHHFINVNLIGVVEGGGFDQFDSFGGDQHIGEDVTKHDGFLSTVAGRAALNKIKNYFTNIGVWLAPKPLQSCFNRKVWWQIIYADRIMEAALVNPDVAFEKIPLDVFYSIGVHARDAFGRRASQCQSLQFVIDWLKVLKPELVPWINPWDPVIQLEKTSIPTLPLVDPWPLVHVALGAAIVSLRQAMPYPPEKITPEHDKLAETAIIKGGKAGLMMGLKEYNTTVDLFSKAISVR